MLQTIGISPKAILAFLLPIIAASTGAVGDWLNTGNFQAHDIRLAAAGVLAGGVAAIGAYVGHPGNVVGATAAPSTGEVASDALLADALGPPPEDQPPVSGTTAAQPVASNFTNQPPVQQPPQEAPPQ